MIPNGNVVPLTATGLATSKVGVPLKVVAPKVTPAVPVEVLPPVTLSVFAPMANVPSV